MYSPGVLPSKGLSAEMAHKPDWLGSVGFMIERVSGPAPAGVRKCTSNWGVPVVTPWAMAILYVLSNSSTTLSPASVPTLSRSLPHRLLF